MLTENIFLFLMLRVILGVLLFFQGYDKIFGIGLAEVSRTVATTYTGLKIHPGLIRLFVTTNAYLEIIAGALLIIGLFTEMALYIVGVEMVALAISFSMKESMWDMRHYFPRLIILALLLWLPIRWNQWSFDAFFWF